MKNEVLAGGTQESLEYVFRFPFGSFLEEAKSERGKGQDLNLENMGGNRIKRKHEALGVVQEKGHLEKLPVK